VNQILVTMGLILALAGLLAVTTGLREARIK
jgi:hypothetical protein